MIGVALDRPPIGTTRTVPEPTHGWPRRPYPMIGRRRWFASRIVFISAHGAVDVSHLDADVPAVTGGSHLDADADHHVYVLACSDGSLYTGYTTDVRRRLAEHNEGRGAKYTRGRTPVTLRYVESFHSRSAAMSREHAIKSLTRAEKVALIGDA